MAEDVWYFASSEDAERWTEAGTREAAEAQGREELDGEPFVIARCSQQSWRYDCFDRLDEEFDNTNDELGDGDGDAPSIDAGIAGRRTGAPQELQDKLAAVLEAWVKEHGRATAWALVFHEYINMPATAEWHAREQEGNNG